MIIDRIKFRAFDKFNGQYYYSENYKNLAEFFTAMQLLIDGENDLVFEQFTGSRDVNNCDMYEDDIIINPNGDKRIIVFTDNSFQMRLLNGNIDSTKTTWYYKSMVAGNMYTHPELLRNDTFEDYKHYKESLKIN